MKKETFIKARNLYEELENLENALDVLGNYDAKAYFCFTTFHNNNLKRRKEVKIPMQDEKIQETKQQIIQRIKQIKEEIEEL